MSVETFAFQGELKKLDECEAQLKVSEKSLREFIISDDFLDDNAKFLSCMSDFQDKVITLVEVVQMPESGLPPFEAKAPSEEEKKEEEEEGKGGFSMPKALVVSMAIFACAALTYQNLIPPMFLVGAVFLSITLMFLPQVKNLVTSIMAAMLKEEEKEETPPSMRLEDWINESLAKMRALYTSARFLIKVQSQTKESIPDYGLPGMDEALYDRRKYFNETLPGDFLSWVGKIIVACDKNAWSRRSMIVSAIVQAKQATAKVT
jgi:hypothetical protein